MAVENKIEFWKLSPVTSTENPVDVTEFLYSAPTEKRFRVEISANDFMFEQPITFQFVNWDGEFYDRLTYSESYDGDSLITTNNAQSASDYKYVSVSVKREGVWLKKYAGKIVKHAVESDEVSGIVSIETESLTVRLKDVVMSEVADIYDGHYYTNQENTTVTISGKVKDIVTKIIKHCTGTTTVEFDDDTDYITATVYGAYVEFDFDDLWFHCQIWQAEAVDSTTCAEFLRTCCVVANAVAFTDWRDGEFVGFFRAKRRSGAAEEMPSEYLKGGFTIQPSFQNYDAEGKAIQSTFTRFDGSTVTTTHKRTVRNPGIYSRIATQGGQKGDSEVELSYLLSVGDMFRFESHDTVYRVFAFTTAYVIKPPLKQAVHEGESFFLVTNTDTSDILYPECFFFKLPCPEIYVASDFAAEGVVKLHNLTTNLQTGYRATTCADSWNNVRGVSVVQNVCTRKSEIEANDFKRVQGAVGVFSCNDSGGGIDKLVHVSDATSSFNGSYGSAPPVLNTNIGSVFTTPPGYHFEQCHAEYTKSVDDDGNIQTRITLYAVCPDTGGLNGLYRFELEYDTSFTDDNFDGGITGKQNYYRLKVVDTDHQARYGPGDDTSVISMGGCFINANALNPYKDDYVYFTMQYGPTPGDPWYVYKMRAYGSDAVTEIYDGSALSSNISLKQIWIQPEKSKQSIYIAANHATANESVIFKNGLSMVSNDLLGGGAYATPNLYGVVHDADCYLDDVHGVCVSYDGLVFFTETSNKKVCVYDPRPGHNGDIYTIADSSMVDAPYQLACVDFVSCFDTGAVTPYYRPQSDIAAAAAVSQGIFYSTPRRNAACEVIDPETDIMPLDKKSFTDVAGESADFEALIFEMGFDWTTHDYKFYQLVETP